MANESAVKEDEATEGATNEAKDDAVEKVPETDEQMATADEWVVAADEVSM
ncbi:unnamed protein product [Prunus armeniaca]